MLLGALLAACSSSGSNWIGLEPPSVGKLAVNVTGLPVGAEGSIVVSGPGGFQRTLSASGVLAGLTPGSYQLAAGSAQFEGDRYEALEAVRAIQVVAGDLPAQTEVSYRVATGRLAVAIAGLPAGAVAAVQVSGPNGYSHAVAECDTLAGLIPGAYTVAASAVVAAGTSYVPATATLTVEISPSPSPATAVVTYSTGLGALAVSIDGLPGGTDAQVALTGPGGFSRLLRWSEALANLQPGTYQLTAGSVLKDGTTYLAAPASQSVTIAGGAATPAAIIYSPAPGSLSVTVAGLPAGVNASVQVTGPAGYSRILTASQGLNGLQPGVYTISANEVSAPGMVYSPTTVKQERTVSSATLVGAAVTYTGRAGGPVLNLTINGLYLTQATQRRDGSVPLVAGRPAYLRVFALAGQANSAQPQVRVRLYQGASLIQTYSIDAPASSVPLSADEGALGSTWNVLVPGSLVQPGLKVLAEVDPAGAIPESNESDNQFPSSGSPAAVDVRALPAFSLRFVPILQQQTGLQGSVTAGNREEFLSELKSMLPVGAYDTDVRAVYTTTAPGMVWNDANGAWSTVLSEMLALRASDASSRYYYGVVHTSYTGGVAGMGYIGGSARAAIGWDYLSSAPGIMAHEVGHNMGRQHAPCGAVAGADPSFPYAGGVTGSWGLDVARLEPKPPSTTYDLMSYCGPAWVSDYNWTAMVAYRQGAPNYGPPAAGQASSDGKGLLIWGRITSSGIVLEPAFTVAAAAESAPSEGPYRLELLSAAGSVLRQVGFAASELADAPSGAAGVESHFAFVVPLDPELRDQVEGLRVHAGARTATRQAKPAGAQAAGPTAALSRANPRQVSLRWDSARYPMVLVRDADSGEILSFARGGATALWSSGSRFELEFSDGVRSSGRRQIKIR